MRGEVLHYDEVQGFGFITGEDGNRYAFTRESLRRDAPMSKGTLVEFQPSGGQATGVFSIRAQMGASVPPAGPAPAAAPQQQFGRDATTAPATYAAAASTDTGLWGYFRRTLSDNYANFSGRARRKEYWGYVLFWFLLFIAVMAVGMAIDGLLGNMDNSNDVPLVTMLLGGVYVLATFVPGLAITVRRIHDIGLSGWFYLLMLLPYVGGLIIFVFSLIPSQKHENKWGPIPAGVGL